MQRWALVITWVFLTSCSLGTDLGVISEPTGDTGGADTARDLGSDTSGPSDTSMDPGADLQVDPPDVADDTPEVPDLTTDPDEPEVPDTACVGDDPSLCPEGEPNTEPTACENAECVYTCIRTHCDLDARPGCETERGEEVCDGRDNDCDGVIDNDLESQACGRQDGVCRGAIAGCGQGTVTCDEEVYGAWAEDNGDLYDGHETEIICDGADNDCDGVVDDNCCAPGAPWTAIPPLDADSSQILPSVASTGAGVMVTWLELPANELSDIDAPKGRVGFSYATALGGDSSPTALDERERSSWPDVARSRDDDRFLIARAAHPGELDNGFEIRQTEVHRRVGMHVELFDGAGRVTGLDQAYVTEEQSLVAWSFDPVCNNVGFCSKVNLIAVDRAGRGQDLGAVVTVTPEDSAARSPRLVSWGTRGLLAYEFSRREQDLQVYGLRWHGLMGVELAPTDAGWVELGIPGVRSYRDWSIIPHQGRVFIVYPGNPSGEVRVFVVDPAQPEAYDELTLQAPGNTAATAGFDQGDTVGLMWWTAGTRLAYSTVQGTQWQPHTTPLYVNADQRPAMGGLEAVTAGRWGFVAIATAHDATPSRLYVRGVNIDGFGLCE